MPDLHARLLAEIERREGLHGSYGDYGHGPFVDEMLAYLGALRAVTEFATDDVRYADEMINSEWGDGTQSRIASDLLALVAAALDVSP